jgi:hypothetical protein
MNQTAFNFTSKIPSNIREAFYAELSNIAVRIRTRPEWLEALIWYETARTMRPDKWNPYGYVGLIQFGNAAAHDMGTTTLKLSKMSHLQQLVYVEKYLLLQMKRVGLKSADNLADLYLLILYPAAIKTKGQNAILPFSAGAKKSNKQFVEGGNVTRKSIVSALKKTYHAHGVTLTDEYTNEPKTKKTKKTNTLYLWLAGIAGGLLLIGGCAYAYIYFSNKNRV